MEENTAASDVSLLLFSYGSQPLEVKFHFEQKAHAFLLNEQRLFCAKIFNFGTFACRG